MKLAMGIVSSYEAFCLCFGKHGDSCIAVGILDLYSRL